MRKEYRFALYGQTESGKTCLLATVAMGAIGHAGGLTAEWLPVTVPKPDTGGRRNRAQREALALHNGKEWLDEAIRRLEEEGIPKGTPPDDLDREVDFKLGSPGRGDVYLRMIDYAGELIDPEKESTPGGASEKLKRELEKSDGFLILVETPASGDISPVGEKVKDAIRPLRQAFSSLNNKKDMVRIPVAVALTKWDRFSKIDFENPAAEKEKLQGFLAANEQLESLARTIANTMVEQSRDPSSGDQIGVPIGNCIVFPVSAFGLSERREEGGKKKELPIKGLVRPFNILSPLIWLAERKDQLDAEKIEENWKKEESWAWLPHRLMGARAAVGDCSRFLSRASRLNPGFHLVEKVRARYRARLFGGVVLFLAAVVFLADSVWSTASLYQFQQCVRVIDDPNSPENDLIRARQWFDSYGTVWRGWFGTRRKSAIVMVENIDIRIENLYWNPVGLAKENNEKYQAAQAYRNRLPNGDHVQEAESILTDHGREEGQRVNDEFLDTLRLEGQTAKTAEDWTKISVKAMTLPSPSWGTDKQKQDLGKIRSLAAANITIYERKEGQLKNDVFLVNLKLKVQTAKTRKITEEWEKISDEAMALPSPNWGTDKQKQDLEEIRLQAATAKNEIANDTEYGLFQDKYKTYMDASNFGAVFKLLRDARIKPDQLAPFVSKFPPHVLAQVRSEVETAVKENMYGDAQKKLRDGKAALESMEAWCKQKPDPVPDRVTEMQGAIRELEVEKTKLNESEDRYLYTKVVNREDKPSCQNYLDNAPVKFMAKNVKAFKEYLSEREKPLDVIVELKVRWGKDYKPFRAGNHQIEVQCDKVQLFLTQANIASKPDTLSAGLGTFVIRGKKLDESVELNIIIEAINFTGNEDAGKGISTVRFSDLDKGQEVELKGNGFTNKAWLTVTAGIPKKAGLPEWKAQ